MVTGGGTKNEGLNYFYMQNMIMTYLFAVVLFRYEGIIVVAHSTLSKKFLRNLI